MVYASHVMDWMGMQKIGWLKTTNFSSAKLVKINQSEQGRKVFTAMKCAKVGLLKFVCPFPSFGA
jgi:hypothetical protein